MRSYIAKTTYLGVLLVTFLFVLASCSTEAASPTDTGSGNNSSTNVTDIHGVHTHDNRIDTTIPMFIALDVEKDAISGVNVCLDTSGFLFAPKSVNSAHVDGEGHAHLYIDGVKWGRMYGDCVYIGSLQAGDYNFRAVLNSNDHAEYSYQGSIVEHAIAFTLD